MFRKRYGKKDLIDQLADLGVEAGDFLLVRVDFGKLGRIEGKADLTLIDSLLERVGKKGAIFALTHSPYQMRWRKDKTYVFDSSSAPCITGRFAKTFLQHPEAIRSQHPTCSLAVIGKEGQEALANHDHQSTCFGPIKWLMEHGGKMLLCGCTESSPGFSTVHYAYEHLGLAEKSLLKNLVGCYYNNKGKIDWFSQRDIAGCSRGFGNFYLLYGGALAKGSIGQGEAFLISAREAFEVERLAIVKDPKVSLCSDEHCFSCRGTKLFNKVDWPRYYLTQLYPFTG